jgi:hypothetical protein
MGSELQTYSVQDIQAMAQAVARSRLFGFAESELVTLMLLCQSQQLHPIKAVQRYSVIQGKPAMKSDAMLADFQQIGGSVKWVSESGDCESAEAIFTHPVHCPEGQTVTFTLEDARRAKLIKPDSGWEKFPSAMLRARVVSAGIRMVAPGIVAGLYTPEEVADFAPIEARARVIDAQPASNEEAGTADEAPPPTHEDPLNGAAPRTGEELEPWLNWYMKRHPFPDLIQRVEDYGEAQGWGRPIDGFGPSDVEQLLPWLRELLLARRKKPESPPKRGGAKTSRNAPGGRKGGVK